MTTPRSQTALPLAAGVEPGSGDIVIVLDRQGRATYWNAEAERVFGLAADAALGRLFRDICPMEKAGSTRGQINLQRVLAGTVQSGTYDCQRPDGGTRVVYLYVAPGRDESGQIGGVVCIGREVTTHHHAGAERLLAEEKYRLVSERASDAILLLQADGGILEANDAFCHLTGHGRDEILGRSLLDFIPRKLRRDTQHWISESVKHRRGQLRLVVDAPGDVKRQLDASATLLATARRQMILVVARDMTEQLRSERAVRESEEKYREIFSASPDAIFLETLEGRILDVNQSACDMLGYTRGQLQQMRVEQLVPPEARAWLPQIEEAVAKHGRYQGEATNLRRDGTEVPVEVNLSVVDLERERVALVIVRDISERRRAEQALRDRERNFRALAENAHDGIMIAVSSPDRLMYANRRMAEITGRTLEELYRLRMPDLLHPSEVVKVATRRRRRAAGEPLGARFETAIAGPGGSRVEVDVATAETTWQGKPARLMLVRDITDRKRAQAELTASESKFRKLAERSPAMVFITVKGRVVYANDLCEAVTGYSRDELTAPDFDFMTLIAPESQQLVRDSFRRHGEGQDIEPYEYALLTKDGRRLDAIITTRLVDYSGEPGILGIVTDITGRKQRERELAAAADTAMALVRLPAGADIFEFVAARLPALLGGEAFVLTSYDERTGRLRIRYIGGLSSTEEARLVKMLGVEPERLVLQTRDPRVLDQLMSGRLVEVRGGLHQALLGVVPKPACRDVEGALGVTSVSAVGLRRGGQLLGNITILTRHGVGASARAIETFASQASIAADRRRAMRLVGETERRYQTLVDRSPIGIYRTTPDGRILMANPALVRMLGFTAFEDLAARNVEEAGFHIGYDRADFKRRIEADGEIAGLESVWTRADGTDLYVRENARLVRDEQGRPAYYEGTVEDITERRNFERELQRERDRAQQYLDVAAVLMVALDRDGRVVMANQRACQVLGYTSEELIGADWFATCLPTEEADAVRQAFGAIIAGEIAPFEHYRNQVRTRSGERRLIEWFNTLVRDDAGSITGTLSSGTDITEQLQAEEEFRLLAEESPNIVFITEGPRLVYVNDRLVELSGYEREELTSPDFDPFRLLVPADQEAARRLAEPWRRGEVTDQVPMRLRTRIGEERQFLVSRRLITHRGREAMLGVAVDVTELRSTETALRESERRFRTLFEESPDGIVVYQDRRVVIANPAAVRALRYDSPDDVEGRRAADFVHEADRAAVERRERMLLNGDQADLAPLRVRFVDRHGQLLAADVTGALIEWGGKPALQLTIRQSHGPGAGR